MKKCRKILSLVLVPSVPLQWDYPRWRGASTEGEREGEPQQKKKISPVSVYYMEWILTGPYNFQASVQRQ